jgi:hypothetical protein
MGDNKVMLISIVALAIISILLSSFVAINMPETAKVPTADEIAAKIVIPAQVPAEPAKDINNAKLDAVYEELLGDANKEKAFNATAINLSMAELYSKDVLKAIRTLLNAKGQDVDEYKDIEVYYTSIEDTDVDIDDETATVEILFKINFINDGDEDLEERAKLVAVFNVNLESGEEEAELDSLDLILIYED